jgi:hypothetical protein
MQVIEKRAHIMDKQAIVAALLALAAYASAKPGKAQQARQAAR